jgi:hypothetical protein
MFRFWGKHLGRFPAHANAMAPVDLERVPQRSELA